VEEKSSYSIGLTLVLLCFLHLDTLAIWSHSRLCLGKTGDHGLPRHRILPLHLDHGLRDLDVHRRLWFLHAQLPRGLVNIVVEFVVELVFAVGIGLKKITIIRNIEITSSI